MIYAKKLFCLILLYSFSVIGSQNYNSPNNNLLFDLQQEIQNVKFLLQILQQEFFATKAAFALSCLDVITLSAQNRDLQQSLADTRRDSLAYQLTIQNLQQLVSYQQQVIDNLLVSTINNND